MMRPSFLSRPSFLPTGGDIHTFTEQNKGLSRCRRCINHHYFRFDTRMTIGFRGAVAGSIIPRRGATFCGFKERRHKLPTWRRVSTGATTLRLLKQGRLSLLIVLKLFFPLTLCCRKELPPVIGGVEQLQSIDCPVILATIRVRTWEQWLPRCCCPEKGSLPWYTGL